MLKTILSVPIGERRSCAMTEYIRSRLRMVRWSCSLCSRIVRLDAAMKIWCATRVMSSSWLNGLET